MHLLLPWRCPPPPTMLPSPSLNSPANRKERGWARCSGGGGILVRGSQCRLEAGPIRISEEAPRLCRSPHPHPGASACLPDWRRLNTATRRKLGSHSSISNKNAEVGMTHDKSTVHESYSSNLFNYLLAQCVSPKTIRKKCAVRPEPGQEVLEPGCFGGSTHLQGRPESQGC